MRDPVNQIGILKINNADSKVKCNRVAKVMGSEIDPKVNFFSITS